MQALIPVADWGLTDYQTAFDKQKELVIQVSEGKAKSQLILTEHHPVFTFGVRKEGETHILWNENKLKELGISVVKANRGGDVTYHGPGQIVGYPIMNLQKKQDLHAYLRDIEQVLINSLQEIGIESSRRNAKTGIWIGTRKIAAIGVAVRRWIAYHGFALNVNNDLSPFDGIIPCGISTEEGTVTSIAKELGTEFDINELKSILTVEFSKIFANS